MDAMDAMSSAKRQTGAGLFNWVSSIVNDGLTVPVVGSWMRG